MSHVHANFIVNAGNATATDIKSLSEYVQKVVADKFNIQLKREIILLGNFDGHSALEMDCKLMELRSPQTLPLGMNL